MSDVQPTLPAATDVASADGAPVPAAATAAGGGGAAAEGQVGDAETSARFQAILDKALESCTPEEQEYTKTLRAALEADKIEVPPQLLYLPLAFVRGFILDTFKDEKERVPMTIALLKEAIAFRRAIPAQFAILETPEARAAFERCFHSYIPDDGGDFNGFPLWVLDLPAPDFAEQLTKEQIIAYHARDFLKLERLKMAASLRLGTHISGHIVVADMSHSKGGLSGAIKIAKTLNATLELPPNEEGEKPKNMDNFYFPESMFSVMILNAPWWFKGLWAVAQLFLEPTTRKKIKVVGAEYGEMLFKRGVLGYLPRYLGGCSPNPTALAMKEYGEGVDLVGRPGFDGADGSPLQYFVKAGSAETLRVCFPRTHRVEWTVDAVARNLVLTVVGHVRVSTRNETVTLCDGVKFDAGSKHVGSFSCAGAGDSGGGGGGGAAKATDAAQQLSEADAAEARHGFVVFSLLGSSSFRATTVNVSLKLVPLE